MVELRPFDQEIIEKHLVKERNDFERAKKGAIKEHLRCYYKYNDKELDDLEISETKYSPKGEGIIYIAVENKEQIRDIYIRKAECMRDEVILKNFVPPQVFQ